MRRATSLALFIFGLGTVATGIWNFFPPMNTMFFPAHVFNSCVFGALLILHVCLNWKIIARYFQRLGWWWAPVILGFLAIIWAGAIVPIFVI